jgi:hypothetical protein
MYSIRFYSQSFSMHYLVYNLYEQTGYHKIQHFFTLPLVVGCPKALFIPKLAC